MINLFEILGGRGSGNFGHKGRPGTKGGSSKGGAFYEGKLRPTPDTVKQKRNKNKKEYESRADKADKATKKAKNISSEASNALRGSTKYFDLHNEASNAHKKAYVAHKGALDKTIDSKLRSYHNGQMKYHSTQITKHNSSANKWLEKRNKNFNDMIKPSKRHGVRKNPMKI